jgi:cytochrome bd-type quinol oxidase subunit 2
MRLAKTHHLLTVAVLGLMAVLLAGCTGDNLLEMFNRWETLGCCGLIIFILDIIAIVEVAGSNKDTGSKVLWILLIFFFPIGGLLFYYFLGR